MLHVETSFSPNQALQPTAGRCDVYFSDDFNTKLRSKARSRQRWLSFVSLGHEAVSLTPGSCDQPNHCREFGIRGIDSYDISCGRPRD